MQEIAQESLGTVSTLEVQKRSGLNILLHRQILKNIITVEEKLVYLANMNPSNL